jgi:hypothetical protein
MSNFGMSRNSLLSSVHKKMGQEQNVVNVQKVVSIVNDNGDLEEKIENKTETVSTPTVCASKIIISTRGTILNVDHH